ncbi:MAG: histidine triad nucleotide-binding protein [Clostridiales bacterium]|nr:histidine triad nucleotide-binding protein [Clostridiales bacterium]
MCIFCKIADKEIPSDVVYENDKVICFNDIRPAAPVHVLIVPKKHYDDVLELSASEEGLAVLNDVFKAVEKVSEITGTQEGFRLINNCREKGGQTVMHVHFHLIGGTTLTEKMI